MSRRLIAIALFAMLAACGKGASHSAAPAGATAATAAPATTPTRAALTQHVCALIPLAAANAALGTTYAEQSSSTDLSCSYKTTGSGESASIVVYRYDNDGMVDWRKSEAGYGTPKPVSGIGDEAFVANRPDLGGAECISHTATFQMQLVASKRSGFDEATVTAACASFMKALSA
jgi:hypothetical protein